MSHRALAGLMALLMLSGCLTAVVGPMTGSVSASDGPFTILDNDFDDFTLQDFTEGKYTRQVSGDYYHSSPCSMMVRGGSSVGQGAAGAMFNTTYTNRELTIDFRIMWRESFYYSGMFWDFSLSTTAGYNNAALDLLYLGGGDNYTKYLYLPGGGGLYFEQTVYTGEAVSLNVWYHFTFILSADRTSLICYLDGEYIGASVLIPEDSQSHLYNIGGITFIQGWYSNLRSIYIDDVSVVASGDPYDPPVWAPSIVSSEYSTWVAPGDEYSLDITFNETCEVWPDEDIILDFINDLSDPDVVDAYSNFYNDLFGNMQWEGTTVSSRALVDSDYLTTIPIAFVATSYEGTESLHVNWEVIVSEEPPIPPESPVASFTVSASTGTAPMTVTFTDTSSGAPTAWEWNFDGDGVVDSTEQHPTVTYSHPGVYTVSLRVTNAGGTDYIAKQSYIVVTAPEDETDSYPSVSTEGGIAYSYGDDLTILSGDRIYLYSKWSGSPVGQISDENRAYITLDTRFISLYASSAELTLWFHRNNAGQIDVYSANFGDALQTYDWGCGVVHGSFIATASVPWGAENPVKVTIDVPIDQINVGGYTQFEIRPTNPGLSAYLYMSTSEHPPTLRVDGVTSNAISYTLANGTVHSTNLRPTISDINPVLLMYSFDIHVWEGVASVRMEKQDDWKLIGFSPIMAWVNETAEYIEFGVAVAPGTYTIQFSVPNKGPVTAHVAIYSSSTGEGFPFETFRVRVSPGTWFSGANARDVMADSIELNRGEAYTFAVSDHFGNIIATRSVLVGSGTTYISIPLDIHSFKVFNQKEDFTRFSIYYQGAGEPLRFFCAPNEPVERFLRPGDYTVMVTYYADGVAGTSEYFEISVEDAEFLMVRGNTISRVISDIQGVNALQQVITELVTPDMVIIKEDMPTVPTGPVEYVHPWSVVTATTRQNGSGTDVEFRVPHPGAAGTTYTILDDRLYFTGAYNTEVWVNSTDGVVYHGTTLPSSIALNGQAVTVETSSPVSCERVSKWRGEDLFYYSYYTAQRRYEVTLNVNNSLDWGVLENVDWFIGFPENRSIDLSSVRIQDLDNAVWLVSGLNYDITQSGMRMTFDSLSPAAVRSFKFSMYDANATSGQGTAQATIDTYDATRYDGEPYYVGRCSWTNSFTYGYSGIYTIALTFDKARYIDPSSIVVIDRMRSRQLLPGEFTYTGSSIIISNVENVPISAVYGFEVYFWIDYGQVEKVDLGAPLPGLGVSPIVLMIVGAVGLGGAFAGSYVTRGRHTSKLGYVLLTYGSIVAILLILSMQGMI